MRHLVGSKTIGLNELVANGFEWLAVPELVDRNVQILATAFGQLFSFLLYSLAVNYFRFGKPADAVVEIGDKTGEKPGTDRYDLVPNGIAQIIVCIVGGVLAVRDTLFCRIGLYVCL